MKDIRKTINRVIDDFIAQVRSNPSKPHDIRMTIQKAISSHAEHVNCVYILGGLQSEQYLAFVLDCLAE